MITVLYPICPYCGFDYKNIPKKERKNWEVTEDGYEIDIECRGCSEIFITSVHVTAIEWSTWKSDETL